MLDQKINIITKAIFSENFEGAINETIQLFEYLSKEYAGNGELLNQLNFLMVHALDSIEKKDYVLLGDILNFELYDLFGSYMQKATWAGDFGVEYIGRNDFNINEVNELYLKSYGIDRIQMNTSFLKDMKRDIKILEVGSNVGNQVGILLEMGFTNITAVDVQAEALKILKERYPNVQTYLVDGKSLPFENDSFDLVYTSGVLIHIHPQNLVNLMNEIYRVSREYVWGFEYYSEDLTEINYRGQPNLLWKADYACIYQRNFLNLSIVKSEKYRYLDDKEKVDQMFLLKKVTK